MKTVTIPFNSLYRDELWSDTDIYILDDLLKYGAECFGDTIANRVWMETFHNIKRVIQLHIHSTDVASVDGDVFRNLYVLSMKQTEAEFREVLERVLVSAKEPKTLGKITIPAMIDEDTEIVIAEGGIEIN